MATSLILPQPLAGIHISPFRNGEMSAPRYVVESGHRSFVVSDHTKVLIEALSASRDPAQVKQTLLVRTGIVMSDKDLAGAIALLPAALFDQGERTHKSSLLLWQVPLLRETWVTRISACLQFAFGLRGLAVTLLLGTLAAPFWVEFLAAPKGSTWASPYISDSGLGVI